MAKQHLVVCVQCGKQFDANKGGYYDKERKRYTCKACGKDIIVQHREKETGMKQSKGAMIAKIVIGIIVALAGFSSPESGWSIGYFVFALILGGLLVAWGIVPYIKAKNKIR